MTAILLIACMVVAQARAGIVELNCSDNATCIEHMAKEFARSMRQQKTVRVFDTLTIEPVAVKGLRQARSTQGFLSKFLESHAFSFDWDDWSFRLTKPEGRSGVVDLEVYESRTAKDVSEQVPKKSNSKVEEEEDKTPKRTGLRRRQKKKIFQALIPLLFGMKSAGAVIFAMALVTALTLKAYVASKLALLVTLGMAIKKLYETYGQGVGLQNHPYLYSQYPIDFPSASSQHTYSVPGMNPQFPEMYNPALAPHAHELLQHNDASAQQSQQQPTLIVNSTRASERWDGTRVLKGSGDVQCPMEHRALHQELIRGPRPSPESAIHAYAHVRHAQPDADVWAAHGHARHASNATNANGDGLIGHLDVRKRLKAIK